jgi:hypothetical protein
MLIGLLGVWLGIFGPLPPGATSWLQAWQTLIAATVASTIASIASYVAFQNTSRSLAHSESLETNRRQRKHAAIRAILPLALSQVNAYAEHYAKELVPLISKCHRETLPVGTVTTSLLAPLSPDALKTLTDFIEYTDVGNLGVLESTVALIQIHDARMRSLVEENNDLSLTRVVVQSSIEGRIIDAVSIYAGASAYFNYARRRVHELPSALSWDDVIAALRNIRLWDDEHPRLYADIENRRKTSSGPFAVLKK